MKILGIDIPDFESLFGFNRGLGDLLFDSRAEASEDIRRYHEAERSRRDAWSSEEERHFRIIRQHQDSTKLVFRRLEANQTLKQEEVEQAMHAFAAMSDGTLPATRNVRDALPPPVAMLRETLKELRRGIAELAQRMLADPENRALYNELRAQWATLERLEQDYQQIAQPRTPVPDAVRRQLGEQVRVFDSQIQRLQSQYASLSPADRQLLEHLKTAVLIARALQAGQRPNTGLLEKQAQGATQLLAQYSRELADVPSPPQTPEQRAKRADLEQKIALLTEVLREAVDAQLLSSAPVLPARPGDARAALLQARNLLDLFGQGLTAPGGERAQFEQLLQHAGASPDAFPALQRLQQVIETLYRDGASQPSGGRAIDPRVQAEIRDSIAHLFREVSQLQIAGETEAAAELAKKLQVLTSALEQLEAVYRPPAGLGGEPAPLPGSASQDARIADLERKIADLRSLRQQTTDPMRMSSLDAKLTALEAELAVLQNEAQNAQRPVRPNVALRGTQQPQPQQPQTAADIRQEIRVLEERHRELRAQNAPASAQQMVEVRLEAARRRLELANIGLPSGQGEVNPQWRELNPLDPQQRPMIIRRIRQLKDQLTQIGEGFDMLGERARFDPERWAHAQPLRSELVYLQGLIDGTIQPHADEVVVRDDSTLTQGEVEAIEAFAGQYFVDISSFDANAFSGDHHVIVRPDVSDAEAYNLAEAFALSFLDYDPEQLDLLPEKDREKLRADFERLQALSASLLALGMTPEQVFDEMERCMLPTERGLLLVRGELTAAIDRAVEENARDPRIGLTPKVADGMSNWLRVMSPAELQTRVVDYMQRNPGAELTQVVSELFCNMARDVEKQQRRGMSFGQLGRTKRSSLPFRLHRDGSGIVA